MSEVETMTPDEIEEIRGPSEKARELVEALRDAVVDWTRNIHRDTSAEDALLTYITALEEAEARVELYREALEEARRVAADDDEPCEFDGHACERVCYVVHRALDREE